MRRILIVGGGYAGFYTAWKLEKKLGAGEAQVTIIDPRPYMTYQPFLPEVTAGSIEPRHSVVPLPSSGAFSKPSLAQLKKETSRHWNLSLPRM